MRPWVANLDKGFTGAIAGALLLVALIGSADAAGSVAVVASRASGIDALTPEQAADIFLGRQTGVADSIPLVPLDSSDHALRERFYQAVAGMTTLRVKAYWSRLVFSGRGRPPPELDLQEAERRLAGESTAVTYVHAHQVTPAMKVLLELP